MDTGIVVCNFGEPPEPDREAVVDYLTRIFLSNRDLEGETTREEAMARSRELAERRAPSLVEEYEAIGGSPLNPQAEAQAAALAAELRERGYDVATYVGMQFTEPTIEDAIDAARTDGVERVVGLPVYPLCGPSTTVAALDDVQAAIDDAGWEVPFDAVSGWHRHPTYNRIRAENVRQFADEEDLDVRDDDTALVFSAHGTPIHYVEEGSRYVTYVEEFCETMGAVLGVSEYELGYQNHENRDIPWTEPDVETVVEGLDAGHAVVEPVSFMHEQSETLSELDVELHEEAAEAGVELHRVPVPHDDDRFPGVLADLVEPFLAGFDPGYSQLRQCVCRDEPNTMCLNAPRR